MTIRTIRVPGDKSLSHRALMFAALAAGRSRIDAILESADIAATAEAMRALGVEVGPLGTRTDVHGVGLRGLRESVRTIDCGNSGTTARLIAGILAASPFTTHLVGDASLTRRPMRRIAEPLGRMGARIELSAAGTFPMTIHGGELAPLSWASPTASAQVKSAILLAGLTGGVEVEVREPAPSRDHTERMLGALGAVIEGESGSVRLRPVPAIEAFEIRVPGDPSSAAFMLALAALLPARGVRVEGICLNPTRTGFIDALRRMGASLEVEERGLEAGEPVGDVTTTTSELAAITVDGGDVPAMIDELPMLACLATRARGDTVVRGAEELRVKESDRIRAVVENLRAVGADAEELPDGFRVTGSHAPLRGRVVTHGDHRIAMAFGVLGAVPGNDIAIDDRDCVNVSYPSFWRDLAHVRD